MLEKALVHKMVNTRSRILRRRKGITVIMLLAAIVVTLAAVSAVMFGIITRPREPNWQPLGPAAALLAAEPQRATLEGQIVYVSRGAAGPQVLNARDPYRGCVVAWQPGEQRFADPCYGSRYQPDGTYIAGPAPRGLDRYPAREADGMIEIDLNQPIPGSPHS